MTSASAAAARAVERVREDPAGRYELAATFYRARSSSLRRFGNAELRFLRWLVERGVLASPDAVDGGSSWWRAVSERLLRDKLEAELLAGSGGVPSHRSVGLWVSFLRTPRPTTWYRAHNASIVAGYLESEPLAFRELPVERFMMNVALLRVLFAHALVAVPRLALGSLAPLGPLVGDPRGPGVALFLDLRRSFPVHYPLRMPLVDAIAAERRPARALDYGVIAPRLPELYGFSAECLGEPDLAGLLHQGTPAYADPAPDPRVWASGNTGRHLRVLAGLTGARERYDRQFGPAADPSGGTALRPPRGEH